VWHRLARRLSMAFVAVIVGLAAALPGVAQAAGFTGPTSFPVGPSPDAVAVGDFNGDGHSDLAVANLGSTVSVLLGDGRGHFAPEATYSVGMNPSAVAVGDVNGDGHPDLVTANVGCHEAQPGCPAPTVSVLLGDGSGSFAPQTTYAVDAWPESIAVGNFNGDAEADFAVASSDGTVSVFLAAASGSLVSPGRYTAAGSPNAIADGDLNGDGRQDLVVANAGSDDVSTLMGDGTGGFGTSTRYPAGNQPSSLALGDFNSDGAADVAVSGPLSGGCCPATISILIGDGNGGLTTQGTYPGAGPPASVAVADFNDDGRSDLAVGRIGAVDLRLGDGTGSFGPKSSYSTPDPTGPTIAIGDFNEDGNPDIAAVGGRHQFAADFGADGTAGYVSVLLNAGPDVSVLASTYPVSPANRNTVKVKGMAESGTTVRVYASPTCTGSPLTSGDAGTFSSPGIPVTVSRDSSTTLSATASYANGSTSVCSASSLTYVEDETAPVVKRARIVGITRAVVARRPRRERGRHTYRLHIRATDRESGVKSMQITNRKRHPRGWVPFDSSPTVQLAGHKVFVRVRDGARNRSNWATARGGGLPQRSRG
jgi:hypothetical protein